jgi:hypothetical protein
MSANVEAMVREGVNAYKAGRRDEARALLLKATELDQSNVQAWLWLSGLMDTPDDQRTCLENVLAINPNNERARQGLSFLSGQTTTGTVSPFSASAPPSEPSSPGATATSVDWGADAAAPAEPYGNQARPGEPTGAALDDWVSNLNLPSAESASSTPAFMRNMAASGSSPFGDFDLNEDDATFTSGPFGGAALTFDDDDRAPEMSIRYPVSSPMSPTPSTYTPPPPEPERTRRARLPNSPPPQESSALYTLDNRHDSNVLEDEEGEMFGYIPPEISPTRLPGTVERTPILLRLGVVLLVVINLALAIGAMLGIMT